MPDDVAGMFSRTLQSVYSLKFQYFAFEKKCAEAFEPRREKTGLRGFRPGPTQTGLYSLRKELEA